MFAPTLVWNFALLEAGANPFDMASATELAVFSSRRLRLGREFVHTRADPFLFIDENWLYIFVEVQRADRPGHIEAYRTRDLRAFEAMGPVLVEPHHLSYPQVFGFEDGIYMVPESGEAGEVALYSFEDFPRSLRKTRILLTGTYYDPTLLHHDGSWWLFATRNAALELFMAPALDQPFRPHPMNPLTDHPARARCGGSVVSWNGSLYRLAQDGTEVYGGNLSALRIDEIGFETYRETLAFPSIFDRDAPWRSQGAHQLSSIRFCDRHILAVDGKQHDLRINRLVSMAFGLIG